MHATSNQISLLIFSGSTYHCGTCGRIFDKSWLLERHLKSLNVQLELYCHICDKFWDVGGRPFCNHTDQLEELHCKFCRSLIDSATQNDHVCFHQNEIVTQTEKRRSSSYVCSYCNKEFSKGKRSYMQFLNHEKQHLKALNSIHCRKCNLKFSTEKEKASHKYRFHKRVPIGVCDICGLTTKHIARHRAVHLNDRPFQCERCSKTFRANYGLKKHMLVHSDEAKHQCKVCGKAFKFSYNLVVHMRIHDENKPFTCPVCNKQFTTKQWRDKHTESH